MKVKRSFISRLLETDLSKKSAGVKVFQFLSPWILYLILAGGSALAVYLIQNWESAKNLLYVWWFYMIPPMGKEVIIPRTLAQDHHPPPLVVALTTSAVDIIFSLFLIWNYDWVKKIPIFGPKVKETEEKGRERIAKTKWFSKVSFIATSLFVMVPFSGAGGFGGTILGRLMGVKPYKVLLAVSIGSIVEAIAFAIAADTLVDYLEGSFIFTWLTNVNILQIFAVFAMLSLLIYIVRHPRDAVTKTSTVARKSIEISEKALIKAEGLSRDSTKFSVVRAKKVIEIMRNVEDDVIDNIPSLGLEDIIILDGLDKEERKTLKDIGLNTYKGTRSIAKDGLDKGMDTLEDATETTMEKASKITIVGLDLIKDGIDEGEFLILMVGDQVEKVIKVPKDLLKINKK